MTKVEEIKLNYDLEDSIDKKNYTTESLINLLKSIDLIKQNQLKIDNMDIKSKEIVNLISEEVNEKKSN